MSLSSSQSRVGPAHLNPIVFEGKRYKQILNSELLDLPQRTWLMMIIDGEEDVQDVFFTVFELDAMQRAIRVANEHGARFIFLIDDQSVRTGP